MAIKERMSGNEAVSYAIRQINPDVMPAFPITPSTEIPQMVSTYIANGEMDTEFIPVESEHSSMSATIGAEAAGARSLTATSSAGLALMWEELLLAASNRLPLVMALVNRTLSGPININCDHSDGMGARDTGWIQIYAENNQEAYDNFIQAYPIAEDTRVHLPVMIARMDLLQATLWKILRFWKMKRSKILLVSIIRKNFVKSRQTNCGRTVFCFQLCNGGKEKSGSGS